MREFDPWMMMALRAATASPDPSTQNGAIIVGHAETAACNRFPPGVQYTDERWERPLKYRFIEHAERGAIYRAALLGIPTGGATLVCPWAACSDCARAIVLAGITQLVRFPLDNEDTASHWHEDCVIGDTIMAEAGVTIIEDSFGDLTIPPLRRNGTTWTPRRDRADA